MRTGSVCFTLRQSADSWCIQSPINIIITCIPAGRGDVHQWQSIHDGILISKNGRRDS